jgi:hypothetical protein
LQAKFLKNSKLEIRNPKQIQKSKKLMIKTKEWVSEALSKRRGVGKMAINAVKRAVLAGVKVKWSRFIIVGMTW